MKIVTHNDEYADTTYVLEENKITRKCVYHMDGKVSENTLEFLVNQPATYMDVAVTDKGYFTVGENTGQGCFVVSEEVAQVWATELGHKFLWLSGAKNALRNPAKYADDWRKKIAKRGW